jgi:hypothetical protein
MAELKTQRTKASVSAFIDSIPDSAQRKDARQLAALMRRATGKAPAMWGSSIVGYGDMTYLGSSGRSGEWFRVGFAARKAALTVYLMGGLKAHVALLKRLGRHKVGGGCLYLPSLADVDTAVLTQLVTKCYEINTGVTPAAAKPAVRKRAR